MLLEDYFDFEGSDMIRLKGHRIGIHHVVRLYRQGYSPEQIALEFPGLSLEQIHATLTYYLHKQTEIDALIARIDTKAEADYQTWLQDPHGGQSPLIQRLRAVRAQWERDQSPAGTGT
jgi:uncharacterized protein (DUF433 family)